MILMGILCYKCSSVKIYSICIFNKYFFFLLVYVIEACSSRTTPKPRPPTTQRPNITFHTYICPPAYDTWYCLNGATCFTVKIQGNLLYNCECADGYMGPRCEYKDLDGSYIRKYFFFFFISSLLLNNYILEKCTI